MSAKKYRQRDYSDEELRTSQRISAIADHLNAKTYLEIGVRDGATFFNISMTCKVAVDPNFLFDPKEVAVEGEHYFSTTSDIFFANLALNDKTNKCCAWYAGDTPPKFDIIFIDGHHTFEQSYRDFESSLPYSHDKTVWILDDTIPVSPYSAIPDLEKFEAIRTVAGIRDASWHGDVYKTIPAIHDNYPEFIYCTIMNDNPQTEGVRNFV